MVKNYFVIEIDGEDNVGNIGIDITDINDNNLKLVEEVITPKVIEAVQSHFDSGVKVVSFECNDASYSPIFTIVVALDEDNDDVDRTDNLKLETRVVTLVRTWVY